MAPFYTWYPWYAWRPVLLDSGEWAWLRWVERYRVRWFDWDDDAWDAPQTAYSLYRARGA